MPLTHEDGSVVLGPPPGKQIRAHRANKKLGYLGNPKIKRAHVQMKLSSDEVNEWMKCADNPVYFMRAYMKIVNIDGGLIPFDMYDYQEDLVTHLHENRFSIVLQCRQSGKSTVTAGYILWYVLFHSHKNIGILANKARSAARVLARIKLAYEKLPFWLQQGIVTWNKGDIELENGSIIGTFAASADSARGESFSLLFVDECAFVAPQDWEDYYKSSYPTISSGKSSKIMLVSTANGLNHFHQLYQGAVQNRNSYMPFEVRWDMVPGRDEAWKQETIANTSKEDFEQEHENIFLGGQNTLIDSLTLRNLVYSNPELIKEQMKIYKEAEKSHKYFLTLDVSRGVGNDYSALSVIDITQYPYPQVATWRENKISTLLLPNVVEKIAKYYNDAYVLIEVNDLGEAVAQTLNWDLEYENIISTRYKGARKSRLGLRVDVRTKKIGCNRLKDMVESSQLVIHDENTISELYQFQAKGNSYEAYIGNDDLVMGLVNFAYYASTDSFKNLFNVAFGDRFTALSDEQLFEDLCPAPVVDRGYTEDGQMSLEDYQGLVH